MLNFDLQPYTLPASSATFALFGLPASSLPPTPSFCYSPPMPKHRQKATSRKVRTPPAPVQPALPMLLSIDWIDAATEDGWYPTPVAHRAHRVTTVGFLLAETDDEVVLAGDVSTDTMEAGKYDTNRRIAIPKAWIKGRKKLVL